MKQNHALATAAFTAFLAACSGGGGGSSSSSSTPAPTPAPDLNADWLQQNAAVVSSTDPSVVDFTDLKSFGDAIGNARIVSLGEESHGSGTTFDMKVRLVKYLHEQKGFDVLMFESGVFDGARIWQLAQQGQLVDDIANNNLFYPYADSAESRKALQYIDSERTTTNPLILSSMDSNLTGKMSQDDLFPMLESFLSARSSSTLASSNWPTYKEVALMNTTQYVTPQTSLPPQNEIDTFYAVSAQLQSELCVTQADTYTFPDSPGFWCRVAKSLSLGADRYLYTLVPADQKSAWLDAHPLAINRDIDMADNAQWLIDHPYAGHKIIIWSHITHVARIPNLGTVLGHDIGPNMGYKLEGYYGGQTYIVNFTASTGSDMDFTNYRVSPIAADFPSSAESIFYAMNKPVVFIDSASLNAPASINSLPVKNINFSYVDGWTGMGGYDGLFYFRTVAPMTMTRYPAQ